MTAADTPASVASLIAAMGDSWPPASSHRAGPWLMREGRGGGNRVSAATVEGAVEAGDLATLEDAAARMGQGPLVMLRPGEDVIDTLLAAAGYGLRDETVLYRAPAGAMDRAPRMAAFATWPPLAIQRDIWAAEGTGAGKQAVMDRAAGPKAAILGRLSDRAAGAGYVCLVGDTAFVHALTVLPAFRRRGCARYMLWAADAWAQAQGAAWLALAVTRANAGARALYASQGMQIVGHYHYRAK